MNQTFQNSAQVISIGVFFTLMILGLGATLPHTLRGGLEAHGVSAATAGHVAKLPTVSVLFAAFLGYNPIQQLVGSHALASLSAANRSLLTGHSFFSQLISRPFRSGLHEAFAFAIVACLVGAVASLARGRHREEVIVSPQPPPGMARRPTDDRVPVEAAPRGSR
jgi:hypothetical protein